MDLKTSYSSNFRVELVGHASLRVQYNGKTFLTDPWYVDPINCNTLFHWPPLVHDLTRLAEETDCLYISHVHPDHFDPQSLIKFPKNIPIYIGKYAQKAFYKELESLGFTNVIEVPFQSLFPALGTDFEICILESDYAESAAYDSSIIIKTPEFTVFNNNDCLLAPEKYEWINKQFKIDYAFLGYSHASFFPVCFEFKSEQKKELLRFWSEKHYQQFVDATKTLKPKIAVPFAMGIRFLQSSMTWQNIAFNRPEEAIIRIEDIGIRGELLNPGDFILPNSSICRKSDPLIGRENDHAIEEYSRKLQPWINSLLEQEAPADSNLIEKFKEQILGLWKKSKKRFPNVAKYIIAYKVSGPQGGKFYFDFSKYDNEIFAAGAPEYFDMQYTYEDKLLQRRVNKEIDWDEINFSNRISVCQNKYAEEFYAMIRSEEGLLSMEEVQ